MSISDVKDKLTEIQKKINKMMKDRRYKKANKFMEWQNEYSAEILKCAGELRKCREELSLVITDTARAIKHGRAEIRNISLQEKELENAAMGYLVVDDAIYALQSVNNYDAINDAFETINLAAKRLYGERPKKKMGTLFRHPEREDFKTYLESDEINDARELVYKDIKENLIASGNIEECLKQYRQNMLKNPKKKTSDVNESDDNAGSSSYVSTETPAEEDDAAKREKIERDKGISFNTAPPKID